MVCNCTWDDGKASTSTFSNFFFLEIMEQRPNACSPFALHTLRNRLTPKHEPSRCWLDWPPTNPARTGSGNSIAGRTRRGMYHGPSPIAALSPTLGQDEYFLGKMLNFRTLSTPCCSTVAFLCPRKIRVQTKDRTVTTWPRKFSVRMRLQERRLVTKGRAVGCIFTVRVSTIVPSTQQSSPSTETPLPFSK